VHARVDQLRRWSRRGWLPEDGPPRFNLGPPRFDLARRVDQLRRWSRRRWLPEDGPPRFNLGPPRFDLARRVDQLRRWSRRRWLPEDGPPRFNLGPPRFDLGPPRFYLARRRPRALWELGAARARRLEDAGAAHPARPARGRLRRLGCGDSPGGRRGRDRRHRVYLRGKGAPW
jgi:hypothetical protein